MLLEVNAIQCENGTHESDCSRRDYSQKLLGKDCNDMTKREFYRLKVDDFVSYSISLK